MRTIQLEARPTNWHPAAGITIAGYGYNGQVPGRGIERRYGERTAALVAVQIEYAFSAPSTTRPAPR